jgi:Uncharacterized conserved protein (COG2071)
MRIPTVEGLIKRRILVNYRVDAELMRRFLPQRFRPKLQADYAIAGICLIRLEQIRPAGLPAILGISSENAAHRVAVLWDEADGRTREGVFIPRRDTSSLLNHLAGGRIFPGEHQHADFRVTDAGGKIDFAMKSRDGSVSVELRGTPTTRWLSSSVFGSLEETSRFFEAGSVGFSVTKTKERFDGLQLKTSFWKVEALVPEHVQSSFFADEAAFPAGSVEFDHALLMREIPHRWVHEPDLHSEPPCVCS